MTRIIAGSARGRRLVVPAGRETRPTADRAREGFFSTLESLVGSLDQLRFLDLYAGSGAVGLEAISRGAAYALFVEANRRAAESIRLNAETLGFRDVDVHLGNAEGLVRRSPPVARFDVLFADPPYSLPDESLRGVVTAAQEHGWLAEDAVVVVERPSRGIEWAWSPGIRDVRFRRYGEATLWYGRAAGPSGSDESSSESGQE